jgi:hypothetical protein
MICKRYQGTRAGMILSVESCSIGEVGEHVGGSQVYI